MFGEFPQRRMRRTRSTAAVRALVRESVVTTDDLVWPLFLTEGTPAPVASMPGVSTLDMAGVLAAAAQAVELGIRALAVFPAGAMKDDEGSEAFNASSLLCQCVRALRREHPALLVLCDVALDPYTSTGHDGIVVKGRVDNDVTLAALERQALVLAEAGCEALAPSDMMDGRVQRIRRALDAEGFIDVQIISYAAKYASAWYGPFRGAVGAAALVGDKRTYQMDPGNAAEALHEVALDVHEGADMVMVKPGLLYLDVIHRVRSRFEVPVLAYQVSGEYAAIEAAVAAGSLERRDAVLETMLAFKRAGACAVVTYFAPQIARWLR